MIKPPPEKLGSFYLGAGYDLTKKEVRDDPVNYDAFDIGCGYIAQTLLITKTRHARLLTIHQNRDLVTSA